MNWRSEENLVVNNKDNRVLMSGLIVAPCKFDVLKTIVSTNYYVKTNICPGSFGATIRQQFLDSYTLDLLFQYKS